MTKKAAHIPDPIGSPMLEWKIHHDREADKKNKAEFPTYDAAIAEIRRLQEREYSLQLANGILQYKRPRGRPKSPKTKSGGMGSPFGLGGFFGYSGNGIGILDDADALPTKKKFRGRPPNNSIEEMAIYLKEWEQFRQKIASKIKKKTVTDKDAVEYICKEVGTETTERKTKSIITAFLKKIAYFRDQTGIRIRKNKSRKLKK
jgi:hypothetical protein